MMTSFERCVAIVECFLNGQLEALDFMGNYVSDKGWREEFEPVLLNKDVIRKLIKVYEEDSNKNKFNVLQFLTNLACGANEINTDIAIEMTEGGLLWCIYKNLYLSNEPSDFQINLCCNSIVCLSNLIYMSEHVRDNIMNSNLFECLGDLLKSKELNSNFEFTKNFLFILRNAIKFATEKDIPHLEVFISKIDKEFTESNDDELLESILYGYAYLFKLKDEFVTSPKIVELLISKLESKSMSIKFLSLQGISQITAFKENKYDGLINVAPHLSKLILSASKSFKRIVLTTVINLLAIYREEAVDIFLNNTSILHQIFHCLGTESISLKIDLLQALEKFIGTSNLVQLHKIIDEGILTHVTERIGVENNDITTIQEYLTLIYHIFSREKLLGPDSTVSIEEFEYIGGIEIIESLSEHPNVTISEMGDTILQHHSAMQQDIQL